MAGGGAVPVQGRVRIKGRWLSALRFFWIAVSFAIPFVLITSLLGYYSLWFGPQILLELTLAFYVPSIPVLIITGQVESAMDAWIGPTASALCRLLFGLVGCTLVSAAFPFVPSTHTSLLWSVAGLGAVSSIAFSTSYQAVQWFRHADIIALGLGGVTSGPLVLVLQLALNVGPLPERWQWIAMFEITAVITILGTIAAVSLFVQYWNIMSGKEAYIDPRMPLLGGAVTEQQAREEAEEEGMMLLARAATERIVLTPDPFSSLTLLGEGSYSFKAAEQRSALLHRCNSIGSCNNLARVDNYHLLHHPPLDVGSSPPVGVQGTSPAHSTTEPCINPGSPVVPEPGAALEQKVADLQHRRIQQMPQQPELPTGPAGEALDLAVQKPGDSKVQGAVSQQQERGQTSSLPRNAPPSSFSDLGFQQRLLDEVEEAGHSERKLKGKSVQHGAPVLAASGAASPRTPLAPKAPNAGHPEAADLPRLPQRKLTLREESNAVWAAIWQVLAAFFTSVTALYLVFPFFTYVPSSGLLGTQLPKFLFFGRIFADIVGRFAPRRKALLIRSPAALLVMGAIKVVLSIFFFVYIKLLCFKFKSDVLISTVVIVLWALGGYINTSSNILAPSIVEVELVGRASALIALTFQVAHFAGLLLAVLLAFVLYGDLVG